MFDGAHIGIIKIGVHIGTMNPLNSSILWGLSGCGRSWAFLGALFSIFKSVTDTSYFKYICGGTASLSAKRRNFFC